MTSLDEQDEDVKAAWAAEIARRAADAEADPDDEKDCPQGEVARINEFADELNRETEDVLEYQLS